MDRRQAMAGLALSLAAFPRALAAGSDPGDPRPILRTWYRLVLALVRHTPTYSPPVASRSLAYIGVTAFEAMALADPALRSLAGQLNGLTPPPRTAPPGVTDPAAVLDAALSRVVGALFSNTGPTGQRALASVSAKLAARAAEGLSAGRLAASRAQGRAVADHILGWAATDGGAVIENMGFPLAYDAPQGPEYWVPTSTAAVQQRPLLPGWGGNRPFAMPAGPAPCPLPPPPPYSEAPGSVFHADAMEVVDVAAALTDEQRAIARFWSDDPMLSATPPGHWIAIALQVLDEDDGSAARHAEILALTGIALADAFIACWASKFDYDLLRPVTYIRRVIDPGWEPLLNTPPFPEYPSGHSTQSAAAAAVLTRLLGEGRAFTDRTQDDDGLPARRFPSFRAAADEAGISRLYGGIHFRPAIERGLTQGDCVAAFANALATRA